MGPGFKGPKSYRKTMKIYFGVLSIGLRSNDEILRRQKLIQQRWKEMLLVQCVIALSLDPLFCYILVVNDEKKCLGLDRTLAAIASVLRFGVDFFYVLYVIYQFRVSVVTTSSQSSKEGELVPRTRARAWRYLSFSYFIFDILVILPLPQVLVFYVIPKLNDSKVFNATESLNFIFIIQYVLRVARIYTLLKKALRACGIWLAETTWANLCFFVLAGHVAGSFWYLLSIERKATCWLEVCKNFGVHCSLYCDGTFKTTTYLKDSCSAKSSNSIPFDFGIYSDAIESGVVDSVDFMKRFSYCFLWGLQNLSSIGQSLKTSTYVWEIYFSVFILISGLVLIAAFIGNLQANLLSSMRRREEVKKMDEIDLWMTINSFPQELKTQIRQYQKYERQVTRGFDVDSLLHNLPRHIRRETKLHLCSSSLSKVALFQNMDKRLLYAICDHLRPVLYIKRKFIFRKGDPLDEMLFITRGKLLTYADSADCTLLENGDFYGQELLDWVSITYSNPQELALPFSTKTVQAHTDVEVFALSANDLNKVVSKFWWLFPSSSLEQARNLRAAQALQAAWRRHNRQRLAGLTV